MNRPRPVDHVINLSGRAIFSPTCVLRGESPPNKSASPPLALILLIHSFTSYWHYQLKGDVIDRRIESNEILRDLIIGAKKAPKSFVHISSTGIYGNARETVEEEHDEASVAGAHSWWSDTCRRWEAAAVLPEGHPTRRVALRTGLVLGLEGGAVYLARRSAQLARFIPQLSDGTAPLAWIHIDDLVGLVEHILENDRVQGAVHAVAPGAVGTTQGDLHKQLVKRTNAATARVPDGVLDLALNQARAQLLRQGQRVASTRKASDYKFKFPTLDAALDDIFARKLPDPDVLINPNYQFLHESKRPEHPPMEVHDHHH